MLNQDAQLQTVLDIETAVEKLSSLQATPDAVKTHIKDEYPINLVRQTGWKKESKKNMANKKTTHQTNLQKNLITQKNSIQWRTPPNQKSIHFRRPAENYKFNQSEIQNIPEQDLTNNKLQLEHSFSPESFSTTSYRRRNKETGYSTSVFTCQLRKSTNRKLNQL